MMVAIMDVSRGKSAPSSGVAGVFKQLFCIEQRAGLVKP